MKFRYYSFFDKRIVKRFALFPIKPPGEKYSVWFEWCYIKQMKCYTGWFNECFSTKEEYDEFKIQKYV